MGAVSSFAYRQADDDYDGAEEGTSAGEIKIDLNQAAKRPVNQVLDLIGKQVEISTEGKKRGPPLSFPGGRNHCLHHAVDG